MERNFLLDKLKVSIFDDRDELGVAGGQLAGKYIQDLIDEKGCANLIFASSPSQMDVINVLMQNKNIDWSKVNAFHMDEYIGISQDLPQSFANYLEVRFFSKLPFGNVFYMNGCAENITDECQRYANLLREYPTDITFLGIGENGHIAFNDPHIADFNDSEDVKVNYELDDECIQQQVNDGWFKTAEDVPKSAITITIPALIRAKKLIVTVPAKSKASIIKRFVEGEIGIDCPATIIRQHDNATLLLDMDSASLLSDNYLKEGFAY